MPFKLNRDRRHHIPRQRHKVTNSAAYDAALRQRGSLTVWFTAEAIEGWRAAPRTTPGGQPCYSSLAILTALTLRAVFRLALRQTEGLIGSIIHLLGLTLRVPDHSTLSRRAKTLAVPRPQRRRDSEAMHLLVDSTGLRLCGAGEWLQEKHGTKMRRSWRKLHLGLDAETGQIVAASLTAKEVDDGAAVGVLLDQIASTVATFVGDGGYDRAAQLPSPSHPPQPACPRLPPQSSLPAVDRDGAGHLGSCLIDPAARSRAPAILAGVSSDRTSTLPRPGARLIARSALADQRCWRECRRNPQIVAPRPMLH